MHSYLLVFQNFFYSSCNHTILWRCIFKFILSYFTEMLLQILLTLILIWFSSLRYRNNGWKLGHIEARSWTILGLTMCLHLCSERENHVIESLRMFIDHTIVDDICDSLYDHHLRMHPLDDIVLYSRRLACGSRLMYLYLSERANSGFFRLFQDLIPFLLLQRSVWEILISYSMISIIIWYRKRHSVSHLQIHRLMHKATSNCSIECHILTWN